MVLKRQFQILCLIFFVITVYYPSIFAPFNTVDDMKLVNGLLNTNNISLKDIFFPNSYGQYYRPLVYQTFIFDKIVWSIEPSFMHLENILLHLGNALLVMWLTQLVFSSLAHRDSSNYAPAVTALLFGLHPIATEPVNWISGRTDLLSGFFTLLSFGLFLMGTKGNPSIFTPLPYDTSEVKKLFNLHMRSYSSFLLGALSLLAGCLSKETALFLLPVIWVWCGFPPKECRFSKRFVPFFLYSGAGAFYLIMRKIALGGGDKIITTTISVAKPGNIGSIELFDWTRVFIKTAGFYFKKLMIPTPLNFGIDNVSPYFFWIGLFVVFGLIWCLYQRSIVSYLFLIAFMLTSSAFALPILKITWTPIAERYVYMASAFFAIGITVLYIEYFSTFISTKLTTLVIAAILGSATVVTAQRNVVWQNNLTLFEDTIRKSPNFGSIRNEYAIALREHGRIEEADKIMLTNKVNEFQPSSLNNIRIMVNNGQLGEARLLLIDRLKKKTEYDLLMYELLLKIDELRRQNVKKNGEKREIDNDILNDFRMLIKLTGNPFYYYRSGIVMTRLGDKEGARDAFEKAYRSSPPSSHYHEAAGKMAIRLR